MKKYLKTKYPIIFGYIDIAKTKEIYPDLNLDNLTCGSNLKIYFRCPKCGISRLCTIKEISKTSGLCNHCKGSITLSDYCLKHKLQDIIKEFEISNNISASKVYYNDNTEYFWKCPKCGYTQKSTIFNRVHQKVCQCCSGRILVPGINDIFSKYPQLKNYWDYSLNNINPDNIVYISKISFYWKFKNISLYCRISTMLKYLDNSKNINANNLDHTLKYKYPDIFSQIDVALTLQKFPNINLDKLRPYSKKEVYFKCDNCGKSYLCKINNKVFHNSKCSYCLPIPRTTPKRKKEYIKDTKYFSQINIEKTLEKYPNINLDKLTVGSHKKICWNCKNGHQYYAMPKNRILNNSGCPYCHSHSSKIERILYNIIKDNSNLDIILDYVENNKEIDVYLPKLNIGFEFDGLYYHRIRKNRLQQEKRKDEYFANKNIKIIHISETDDNSKTSIDYEKENIYYIHYDNYTKKYFEDLDKIILDIFKNIGITSCSVNSFEEYIKISANS